MVSRFNWQTIYSHLLPTVVINLLHLFTTITSLKYAYGKCNLTISRLNEVSSPFILISFSAAFNSKTSSVFFYSYFFPFLLFFFGFLVLAACFRQPSNTTERKLIKKKEPVRQAIPQSTRGTDQIQVEKIVVQRLKITMQLSLKT